MDVGFQHFATRVPDRVALVDPAGNEWSRGELAALVNRLARGLRGAGLAPGDVLAIIAPNCAEFVAAFLAGRQAGLLIVPINWHLAEDEIAFVLRDSEARVIVTHADLGTGMLDAIRRHRAHADLLLSIGEAPGYTTLSGFAAPHDAAPIQGPVTGRMMAYTSATTGRPKAVKLPPRDRMELLEQIARINASLGMFPEDNNVHLCASMLYHSAPLGGAEVALDLGHCVVLVGNGQPEQLLELIERHRVTTTFLVPAMFVRLLKLPDDVRRRWSTASLRFVLHGAAPCPPEVKRRMIEWWGEVIWESYGATESHGTLVSTAEWLRRPGTVGKAMSGSEVRILDESGREVPPLTIGRVYLRQRLGERFEYKGDPEKTRASYRGELVSVGDLGYLDADGYLFLAGRDNDLIISSGMNIYAAEIELVLQQHPLVRDCAVLAEPHELLGEVPKAFVELEAGAVASPALSAELLRFMNGKLAAMKLPKRIVYVERIPRDPNGKLFKWCLRDEVAAEVIGAV
ncbi:MAG: AMP-binding protein [Gammaproteobacteria bacterium]|nr:AMP-binding protein [Gammaproteobacteria bacterium]